jgi:hypothetical protein
VQSRVPLPQLLVLLDDTARSRDRPAEHDGASSVTRAPANKPPLIQKREVARLLPGTRRRSITSCFLLRSHPCVDVSLGRLRAFRVARYNICMQHATNFGPLDGDVRQPGGGLCADRDEVVRAPTAKARCSNGWSGNCASVRTLGPIEKRARGAGVARVGGPSRPQSPADQPGRANRRPIRRRRSARDQSVQIEHERLVDPH